MNAQIVRLIDDCISYYSATSFSLYFYNHKDFQNIINEVLKGPKAKGFFSKKDGTNYEVPMYDILNQSFSNREFNIYVMRHSLAIIISLIYDALLQSNLLNKTPELQFLKHLRHACSHGNRFYLKDGEPKLQAQFKTYVIDSSMDDMPNVLFEYIAAGDVLELLDKIKNS